MKEAEKEKGEPIEVNKNKVVVEVADKKDPEKKEEKKLYADEHHDKVSLNTYKKYIKSCGGYTKMTFLMIFILLIMGLGQSFQIVLGYWT